jgi:predicted dehydrogenase
VAVEKDFRRVLDRRDVDAVVVAVPDHWHALQTVMACQAGKDVYVEKPLSLTVREGRLMTTAARTHGRIVQAGSQQRSGVHYAHAVKLVQDGAIGAVHKITAGFTRNVMPGFDRARAARRAHPGAGLGHVARARAPRSLRPLPLHLPLPLVLELFGRPDDELGRARPRHRALGAGRARTRVGHGFGGRFALTDGGETPDVQEVLYDFPEASLGGGKGCVVSWTVREVGASKGEPLVFHGTKGALAISRRGFKVTPDVWKADPKNETPATAALEEPGADIGVFDAAHIGAFIDAVRSRKRPAADVERGT